MKIKTLIISAVTLGIFASCNKTDFNYPEGTVGKSKIIYFPAIAIKGDKITSVVEGTAYTDPGATATLNGADVQFTTSTTITASTAPGVYTISYSASNPQGYSASDFRIVAVIPAAIASDPAIASSDLSGTYLRAATGVTSTWTKIGPGAYAVENAGGAGTGAGLYSVIENTSATSIAMPEQDSPYYGGTISTSNEVFAAGPPVSFSYIFHAPNYGSGVRSFVKQ